MKYTRFEEIPVWQAAVELGVKVFGLTEDKSFRFRGDIASQLQRSALSVSNNIAEGFERGTTSELIAFLYIARGSAGEVRSILCVVEKIAVFAHLRSQISDLKFLAESVSRQLRAWADSLQHTEIRGQRYLTEKSKQAFHQNRRSSGFMARIKKMNEEAARLRALERSRPAPAEGPEI